MLNLIVMVASIFVSSQLLTLPKEVNEDLSSQPSIGMATGDEIRSLMGIMCVYSYK